jgi:hypothetical protein
MVVAVPQWERSFPGLRGRSFVQSLTTAGASFQMAHGNSGDINNANAPAIVVIAQLSMGALVYVLFKQLLDR